MPAPICCALLNCLLAGTIAIPDDGQCKSYAILGPPQLRLVGATALAFFGWRKSCAALDPPEFPAGGRESYTRLVGVAQTALSGAQWRPIVAPCETLLLLVVALFGVALEWRSFVVPIGDISHFSHNQCAQLLPAAPSSRLGSCSASSPISSCCSSSSSRSD